MNDTETPLKTTNVKDKKRKHIPLDFLRLMMHLGQRRLEWNLRKAEQR